MPSRGRTAGANQPCNGGTTEEDEEPEPCPHTDGHPHDSHPPSRRCEHALCHRLGRDEPRPLRGVRWRGCPPMFSPVSIPPCATRSPRRSPRERARFRREPADILITTPESLYLLLTSQSRATLRSIDTVIVDEIHALVPTKRGAHLALSLERLAALVFTPSLQRLGLSATQRPLDEVARFLGGVARAAYVGSTRGESATPPRDEIHA